MKRRMHIDVSVCFSLTHENTHARAHTHTHTQLFEEVNSFVYAPNAPHYDTELLEASFDGEEWSLTARSHVLY